MRESWSNRSASRKIVCTGAPHHPDNSIMPLQKKTSKIRAVLTSNSCNQCCFSHNHAHYSEPIRKNNVQCSGDWGFR